MAFGIEGFGEFVDLAKALGLVSSDGELNGKWFSDPGHFVGQMLRDAGQRDALGRAVEGLLKNGAGSADAHGRRWIPVFVKAGLQLSVVIETIDTTTSVGLGATYATTTPVTHVSLFLPVVKVPASGPVALALGQVGGRIVLTANVSLDTTLASPGEASLGGVALGLDIGTDGGTPVLQLALKRLQLSGESTPRDLVLGTGTDLGADALRSIAGLLQRAVKGASGPLGDLLALIGFSDDTAVPALQLANVFEQGGRGWAQWLEEIIASPAALGAWLGHVAAFVGHGATVQPPADGEHRVRWTIGPIAAEAIVRLATDPAGSRVVEVALAAHADSGLAVAGALEFRATLCRVTFGPSPSATAMPRLALLARVGRPGTSGPKLLESDQPAAVGALRLGFAVDDLRTPRFVLAAHDVTIGTHDYPVLDLTNTQALADVGSNAVGDLASAVLDKLGPGLAPLRVVFGLDAPTGQVGWPVTLTALPELLANPLAAILAYHRRVLAAGAALYPTVIGPLRELLATAGSPSLVTGDGTAATPWTFPIADGVALRAHAGDGRLHLGLGVSHQQTLAANAPAIAGAVNVTLVSIGLDGSHATALGDLGVSLSAVPPNGSFVFGTDMATLHADSVGLGFGWSKASGLTSRFELPRLLLDTGDGPAPFALPAIAADGSITGLIPWALIEGLAGDLLDSCGWLWARELADLLGWGKVRARVRLSLERLAMAPFDELQAFGQLVVGDGFLTQFVGWLSLLITGPSGPGVPTGVRWGYGTRTRPHVLPFTDNTLALRRAGLAWWGSEDSDGLDGRAYRPGNLIAWMLADPADMAAPEPADWVAALARPSAKNAAVADLLADRGDLTAGFAALAARLTDTDGMVPAASAALAGATIHDVEGVASHQLVEGLDLVALIGSAAGAGTIFVTGPMSPPRFGDVADDHVIDLTSAALSAERIDASVQEITDGPWLVQLPSRLVAAGSGGLVGDGLAAVAARLDRVVDAVVQHVGGGGPVVLVAHGASGHAARVVASHRAGLTHLVTIGTPHGGVGLDVLDAQPVAGALQLLATIVPEPSVEEPEHPAVTLGRELLAPLLGAYATSAPATDLAAPAVAPVVPSSVAVHCVVGTMDALRVNQAITALVVRGLEDLYRRATSAADAATVAAETADAATEPRDPALAGGVVVRVASPSAPGQVRTEAAISLAAGGFGDLTGETPRLYVGVDVGRVGGWLAGGPDPSRAVGVDRRPSLRRATIELEMPIGPGNGAVASIVFHDAESLGARRRRWVISHSDVTADASSLHVEARVLLDRLAQALSPVPADGPTRDLIDLAAALGLIDAATPIVTGGPVRFAVDGVRRFLADPGGLLRDARTAHAAAVANAFARLFGAAALAKDATGFTAVVEGMEIVADVAKGSIDVHTTGDGMSWKAGLRVGGRFVVTDTGARSGALRITSTVNGIGLARLVLDNAGARLETLGGLRGVPATVGLHPVPDLGAIGRLATQLLYGQLLHAALTWLRDETDDIAARLDPLLSALGILHDVGPTDLSREGEPVNLALRLPTGLLTDPFGWLRSGADTLVHSHVAELLDGFAGAAGLATSGPGSITLPYGMQLRATTGGDGRSRIELHVPAPMNDTGVRTIATIGARLADGAVPAGLFIDALVGLAGPSPLPSAGRIQIRVSPDGVALRLIVPTAGIDLPLVPAGPGLNDLAAGAAALATKALPFVLDAIAGLPPAHGAHDIGVALAAVGDALALREAGKFSAVQLEQLAASPGPQLAQRLSVNLASALQALGELLKKATPTAAFGWTSTANSLQLASLAGGGTFHLSAALPAGPPTGLALTASIIGATPIAGATSDVAVRLDPNGIAEAHATFRVSHANGLVLGPLVLAPIIEVAVGHDAAGGARLVVGLTVGPNESLQGVLRLGSTPSFALEATGGTVPALIGKLLIPLAANAAIGTNELKTLLGKPAFNGKPDKVGQLLEGVLLVPSGGGWSLDAGALDVSGDNVWRRVLRLAGNVSKVLPSIDIDPATIALRNASGLVSVEVSLKPGQSLKLLDEDLVLGLDVDETWISGGTGGGIVLGLLDVNDLSHPKLKPSVAIRGVGLRLSKSSGPLLSVGLEVKEIGLRGFLVIGPTGVSGAGGQLQLLGLQAGMSGGTGSDDKVAGGVLKDASNGSERPRASFSPSLVVQRHEGSGPRFQFLTGVGDKPVWVRIQRSFGPVYLEQVGLQTTHSGDQIATARIAVDGSISLLGLEVAVQELALQTTWPRPNSTDPAPWDPRAWSVSLAGLAVSADTSGVKISGGLRRASDGKPDYLGMLSVRFGVYGISAYAGYGVFPVGDHEFTSLFIFGALNAPLGGPPIFFVTGIGLGVGVNRRLRVPDNLAALPAYPFIQALDANSQVSVSPAKALAQLGEYFPPAEGAFWFAAGVSFTSFALIDCVVVLAVAIDDGLEIIIMGLARAALPTTAFPLVQIELALMARFSTRDGVLSIRAQLTDNSFLLTRDCRLTGGFAYVMWFSPNKNAGQFVLTLGGYHPSFHRDDYPVVPRLGFIWNVADVLVIKGESYFALTSEAIMAGARFEASLTLGPLWAYLRLGADGIVWFDPFKFEVTAFAEIGAGVTLDIDLGWFGHIRVHFEIHMHADVILFGPELHGRANIDLDVTSATIAFGSESDKTTPPLDFDRFAQKYLQPGGARMLTAVVGKGTLPPSPAKQTKPPTGGPGDPIVVLPEFSLIIASSGAVNELVIGGLSVPVATSETLAIAPMHHAQVSSTLTVSAKAADGAGPDYAAAAAVEPSLGEFPKGVWAAQPQTDAKPIPDGETIGAANGTRLDFVAKITAATVPINSKRVEIGARKPLPFLAEAAVRGVNAADLAAAAATILAANASANARSVKAIEIAKSWATTGTFKAALSPLADKTFATARTAPPQLVPLTAGMVADPSAIGALVDAPVRLRPRPQVGPPQVIAHLRLAPSTNVLARPHTTATQMADAVRSSPPRLADVLARHQDAGLVTQLVRTSPPAQVMESTVVAVGAPPSTRRASTAFEMRAGAGSLPVARGRLDGFDAALGSGFDLLPGEVIVVERLRPGADVDTRRPAIEVSGGLPVRIVCIDSMGSVSRDVAVTSGTVLVPALTSRVALVGGAGRADGFAGWHTTMELTQVSRRSLLGAGCAVITDGQSTFRGGANVATAVVHGSDITRGFTVISTRFVHEVTAIALLLEPVDDAAIGADTLELGLVGASRVVGADGQPVPPVVVIGGSRTTAVYAVVAERTPNGTLVGPTSVTIASSDHWHLAGVVGASTSPDALAERIAARGVDGLVGNVVADPEGLARVAWVEAEQAPTEDHFEEAI